jgi:hypothetical protein
MRPGSSQQQARQLSQIAFRVPNRKAEAWLSYFFLTGFLVAFFFIALFSLGLDLLAAAPGFFIAAIRFPPIGSLPPDEHQKRMFLPAHLLRIIEICYVEIKRISTNLERNSKYAELPTVPNFFQF